MLWFQVDPVAFVTWPVIGCPDRELFLQQDSVDSKDFIDFNGLHKNSIMAILFFHVSY